MLNARLLWVRFVERNRNDVVSCIPYALSIGFDEAVGKMRADACQRKRPFDDQPKQAVMLLIYELYGYLWGRLSNPSVYKQQASFGVPAGGAR